MGKTLGVPLARVRARFGACLLVMLAACGGTREPLALDQPIFVHQADFKYGALPSGGPGPTITSFALGFGVLHPGTENAQITGRTSGDGYSIGVRFADQGSGYWTLAVGAEDPLIKGELQWQLALDAASEIEPGQHQLQVVAFGADGHAGPQMALPVCVASELPDNLNVCNPTTAPPFAIASLSWNADSDLDLTVTAPDGTSYGRSKRSLLSGTKVLARLDEDGVSGCLADGRRLEDFVWNEPSLLGTWHVYANLFDACGKASVSFTLTVYARAQNPDGTFALAAVRKIDGQFPRIEANGGAAPPLFLTDITF